MTSGSAPAPKPPSLDRRLRDFAAANPAAVAIAVYAIVAIAALVAAYLAIFTIFQPYDDEGTLLLTVKAFVHGETLYRDVYSAYGPFYYELFGGFFSLTGSAVTTDAGRSIVIVLWVLTSLLFGLTAQRLTGLLSLGVTGMIAAFAALYVLVNEPMHPQGLCILLLGVFALLAVAEPKRRPGWAAGAAGAVLAALVLTKVNLGLFAVAAAVLAAVWTVAQLHRIWPLRWVVVAAFLALPLFITARDLNLPWVRELLILVFLAALALVLAARPLQSEPGDEEGSLLGWVVAAAIGFALAFVVILAIIVATGPSPSDLYDGIVTQALRIRDLLVLQFPFPPAALDWGIAAVGLAALTTRLRASGEAPALWLGLLRAAAGIAILLAVAHITPVGLNPSAASPDTLPMVLAWVAVVPLAGPRESPRKRFLRVMLAALAIAEVLQVYPVAGSQTGIAAVTFVPVGALCLADALSELRGWATVRGGVAPVRLGATIGVAGVALAATFALNSILLPAATNAHIYRTQQKLALPGAELMRLPPAEVETYTRLVDLLHSHDCSTFIGYPSINSLYLWSGLEAPPPQVPNAWMHALDASQQQRVVDELKATPRPCAIRSDQRAAAYLKGEPPPNLPLVDYVLHDFTPVAEVGGEFQFMLPSEGAGG